MSFAEKPPSVASSSDDGCDAELPRNQPGRELQELHKRINHNAALKISSLDDRDSKTASSNSEAGDESDGGDHVDVDAANDLADIPMGERVTNLSYGPYARRRHLRAPDMSSVGRKHSGHMGPNTADKMHGDPNDNITRRVNKNAPVEERISRRPVSVVRDSVQKKSVKPQDPRFFSRNKIEDQHEADLARRRYGFLYDKTMPVEVKELKAAMRDSTDAKEHKQLQVKLSRLQQSLKQHEDRSLELQVEQEWNLSQKAQVKAGKTPYYLKESVKKARVMEKRFERLEETGQLENFMAKKRKRVASKMHKKLPFRRTHE